MSSPYAFPVGPTRFAESKTSMPPPEPRSRTVSPGCIFASAVGLPQPSDAATASAGSAEVCDASYKSLVMGSQQLRSPPPQEATPPAATCLAAAPYFCFTTSCKFSLLIIFLTSKCAQSLLERQRGFACNTLRTKIRALRAARPCSRNTKEKFLRALRSRDRLVSVFPNDERAWTQELPVRPALRRRSCRRDARREASEQFADAVPRRGRRSDRRSG